MTLPMYFDSKDIPDLHRLIHEPELGGIAKIQGDEVSLSVALFLAVTHRALWLAGKAVAANSIARLGLPGVSRAVSEKATTLDFKNADWE